jgi:hypothetical protein
MLFAGCRRQCYTAGRLALLCVGIYKISSFLEWLEYFTVFCPFTTVLWSVRDFLDRSRNPTIRLLDLYIQLGF